jgi:hypothetical protein
VRKNCLYSFIIGLSLGVVLGAAVIIMLRHCRSADSPTDSWTVGMFVDLSQGKVFHGVNTDSRLSTEHEIGYTFTADSLIYAVNSERTYYFYDLEQRRLIVKSVRPSGGSKLSCFYVDLEDDKVPDIMRVLNDQALKAFGSRGAAD